MTSLTGIFGSGATEKYHSTTVPAKVSGVWLEGATPATNPVIQIHIMVDNAEQTLRDIIAHGGEITQPIGKDLPEITAAFRDPAGNIFGIYQHRNQVS